MNISKIKITQEKLEKNFIFYLFLKEINGSNGLKENEIDKFLEKYHHFKTNHKNLLEMFNNIVDNIRQEDRRNNIRDLLSKINSEEVFILFIFSLKLIKIKPLLLAESKMVSGFSIARAKKLHPLSLEYDTASKKSPYYSRVNGALLALCFFNKVEQRDLNFISTEAFEFLKDLADMYKTVKEFGIEPNQIFMLMFTESINQSIISSAGSNYEDRILDVLLSLGIKRESIKKIHDAQDKSTEYDFFFTLDGKTFGIGAKRTLRERYKQFIKTALTTSIDVTIEITLGLDLNEEKAKTILQHNTYIFVADEIYYSRKYLQNLSGVFKASDLTLNLLKKISKTRY